MEVRVDKIVTSPSGIWLGLQILGPRRSWVRFAKVLVPADRIPWRELDAMRARADEIEPSEVDEPLWVD